MKMRTAINVLALVTVLSWGTMATAGDPLPAVPGAASATAAPSLPGERSPEVRPSATRWYDFIDFSTGTVDWGGLIAFGGAALGLALGGLFGNTLWKEFAMLACKRAALAIDERRKSGQLQADKEAAFKAAMEWAQRHSWAAWLTGEKKLSAQMVEAVAVTPGVGATGKATK